MNKKNFSVIKIAGGGIAGLSAAMYLQRKNFQVEVYEKEKKIGKSRHGDFEGIENWIFSSNNSNAFKKLVLILTKFLFLLLDSLLYILLPINLLKLNALYHFLILSKEVVIKGILILNYLSNV